MKKLLCCIILFGAINSYAQKTYKTFEIKGKIIAQSDQSPIESATVYVERVNDSSLVSYTITNKKGEFILKDKTVESQLRLIISYIGSESYTQVINLSDKPIELKTIIIDDESNVLDEILIKADAPIRIKKDTIEFNLDFFKAKKNATVEEALKKLPGIEIDQQGKIKFNGKEINEVLVNGKPFFGKDPTIATKNLTKDIIDKVQIVDTKTKSEAFTGEDGAQKTKSINLTIKKDKNKGAFGHVSASIGTDNLYKVSGMLNYFKDDLKIGVLGGANNINQSGFSVGNVMMGGGAILNFGFGGRGGGLRTSKNTGFNFSNDYGKNVEISANYNYSSTDSENKTKVSRENILPDRRYFTNNNSSTTGDNDSHRMNVRLSYKIDSTWLFDFNPRISYRRTKNMNQNSSNGLDENQLLTNESFTQSFSDGASQNFNNEFTVTKKYGNKGAYFRLIFASEFYKSDNENFTNSTAEIYGNDRETIIRNLRSDENGHRNNQRINFRYRLPLKPKKLFLQFNLDQNYNTNKSKRSTFNRNTNLADEFNLELSTDFKNYEQNLTPRIGLSYRDEKLSININSGYKFQNLSNNDGLRPELDIKRNFELPHFSTSINYRPTVKSSTRIQYNLTNNAPSLNQLRPFENVDDPLHTIVGNPNLTLSSNHRLYLNYSNYGIANKGSISIYGGANFPRNAVVSKSTIDDNLVRRTEYVNINGSQRFNLGLDLGKSIKIDSLQSINIGLGLSSNLNKSVNFNNEIKYNSRNFSLSPGFHLYYEMEEKLMISTTYGINFNRNKVNLENYDTENFLIHQLSFNINWNVLEKLEWVNAVNYSYNPEVTTGFQKSSWAWNSSISYRILKDKGAITFNAVDILNQKTNVRRTATQNYIEDSQSTILQQYFMLGFRWKFNSLGGGKGGLPPPPPPMMLY